MATEMLADVGKALGVHYDQEFTAWTVFHHAGCA